jgi:hypothetical protein
MRFSMIFSVLAPTLLFGCSDAEEAKRVQLPVVSDGGAFEPVMTDLGYEVVLTSASMVAEDLRFTIAGEEHTSMLRRVSDWLVPVAHAHPGHFQGGEVTGELSGHFVLRFEPGETHEVGMATLLVGTYESMNLTLASADSADVENEDPLLGHTAYIVGTASSDAGTLTFEVIIDSPAGRQLIGIPFEEKVSERAGEVLALRLSPHDALENDSLFDGVDFAALDGDGDGSLWIEPSSADEGVVDAYNHIHRAFQAHDHFVVQPED